MNLSIIGTKAALVFNKFVHDNHLNEAQAAQFLTYLEELQSYNEMINLTAITDPIDIIERHFQDSLALLPFLKKTPTATIVDVGSGGGFPGIPLKIALPELSVVLIEVTQKKVTFLQQLIQKLDLQKIEIFSQDWRTFLRHTQKNVDYILARASLDVSELLRVFKPSSPYRSATLVYWASQHWKPSKDQEVHLAQRINYTLHHHQRFLLFFTHDGLLKQRSDTMVVSP